MMKFMKIIGKRKKTSGDLILKTTFYHVLSTVLFYARYSKVMEQLTGFGMKNSLTLPSLANNFFNSLRDENDEPIYTNNDEFMQHFVRKSTKNGRCSSFNQYYKSTIPDEVFNSISKELIVIGNICEILDKFFEDTMKHRKIKKRIWFTI